MICRGFFRIGCVAVLLGVLQVTSGTSAQPILQSDDGPAEFRHTLTVLSGLDHPTFLTFTMGIHAHFSGKDHTVTYAVQERTSDRFALLRGIGVDGRETNDLSREHLTVSPDYFLHFGFIANNDDQATPTPPETIAAISVTNYDITNLGRQIEDGCIDAEQLHFVPRSNSTIFRIRDLWIEIRSHRICHARVSAQFTLPSREFVPVDMTVDPTTQLVANYQFSGVGKHFGRPFPVTSTVVFTDVKSTAMPDTGF